MCTCRRKRDKCAVSRRKLKLRTLVQKDVLAGESISPSSKHDSFYRMDPVSIPFVPQKCILIDAQHGAVVHELELVTGKQPFACSLYIYIHSFVQKKLAC